MSYLQHHGIKGQKWGVRRFQNPDGSLTPAGKKRASKEYEKAAKAVTSKLAKNQTRMYVDAYNKAADYMNGGGIDRYNAEQRKKYGDDYAKRDGYTEDYYREFDKVLTKHMNKKLNDFYSTDASVAKAHEIVEKYGMTEWNDFAKQNEAAIDEVRRAVESYAE